jgi:excisionase family DNA binding protein
MSSPATTDPIVAADEAEKRELATIERTLERPGKARLVGPGNEQMIIPDSLYSVLLEAVKQLSEGNGIAVLPYMQELTTQQAADILNVSRPHVVSLVDSKQIPHHAVGSHRRIYLKDLLEFKHRRDHHRRQAIQEMGNVAEELDIYDK